MMKDSTTLDVTQLRLSWAIDDVCGAVERLTTRLESCKDLETLEATSHLLKTIETYMKVVGETINAL